MRLNFKTNFKEFEKNLNNHIRNEMPFITAKSLTETAQAAQTEVIKSAQSSFENKKMWFNKNQAVGVKISAATKAFLIASVFIKNTFIPIHEGGGTKLPFRSRSIPVPERSLPKTYKVAGGVKYALKTKNTFIVRSKKTGNTVMLKREKKSSYPVRFLYVFERKVKIKPRFPFERVAETKAKYSFDRIFLNNFNKIVGKG